MTRNDIQGVVVGVDGTPGGGAALVFAMSEAALRGSALSIVTVWSRGADDADEVVPDGVRERRRGRAQGIQDAAVARALGQVDARPVLSRQVVEGAIGEVLSRVAKGAAYLVVGASRKRPNHQWGQGSISDYCLRHSPCAVVVVPQPLEAG
jgi:nucleotide-binding universal stress UspA family protein